MERIYINPKGPNHVFYLDKRFHDLIPYVPARLVDEAAGLLETAARENSRLRQKLYTTQDALTALELEKMERLKELKIRYKPGET